MLDFSFDYFPAGLIQAQIFLYQKHRYPTYSYVTFLFTLTCLEFGFENPLGNLSY